MFKILAKLTKKKCYPLVFGKTGLNFKTGYFPFQT